MFINSGTDLLLYVFSIFGMYRCVADEVMAEATDMSYASVVAVAGHVLWL